MRASYLQPRPGTNGRRIMDHGRGRGDGGFLRGLGWAPRSGSSRTSLDALLPARRRRDVLAPLVDAAVGHVSEYYERKARLADRDVQQRRALERVRAATAEAEREVDREVAVVQESLAGPRVLAALRRQHPRNGEADEAVAAVGRSLRVLLAAADALRERTVRDVVGTLAPDQAGAFLAAMLRFHLGVHRAGRNWGSGNGGRRGL
ncbi:hypothetical protein OsJ_01467 [Oryza sativa Japonica Group]|uniref:DOG1 domain-containing protein n=1 Tax=Oryza sativa subsp. japonica TaxID=39947 RepID=A2ZSA6_ORYSJ|nr:hypothetical protein OsJ_01467 [Oryza sativa Japonica Group]